MESQHVDHILLENSVLVTSIASLVEGYILNCRCESKSPSTISNYLHRLQCFTWFCQHNNIPDEPAKLSTHHVRKFLWYLASTPNRWDGNSTSARKPASQATVNHYYRVLHSFFGWLQQEDLIDNNPLSSMKPPKLEKKIVQALNLREVDALLNLCSSKTYLDVRNRAILMMLLDSGMRVSELVSLRLDDVDVNTGSILVRRGKGGKQRVVRIGTKAQKALWRYRTLCRHDSSDRLFLGQGGEPLGVTGIKLMIRRLGKKAGVHGVHVHRLRHTFAISFLRAGGDVFSLQYLLGHSTLVMTQRYLQSLNADDALDAHRRCSPLDNMYKK